MYIDHENKCVFNGSDLGKPYSANAIQQRFKEKDELKEHQSHLHEQSLKKSENQQNAHVFQAQSFGHNKAQIQPKPTETIALSDKTKHTLHELVQPESTQDQLPYELRKQKRKRKRKRLHL